ncbi:MAG TPA: bifunctional phosphopantothenoylcysteine decarboxylase/phosphopantothenate--cysteine ligase CoaBC [Povalibacter sp.]|uniref:bifunctional phosphopantothenoylcysteine decarboxylase/phosphopantothenate--cysteine ligase CoaBC n=1 Tax=Povalibacter sp. TaxID=1962978 RepID=UPI002B9C2555|nr:bifunctional phosphopantothenoylcysteine decarboxylase/phosphopantothenate--cysteine ligase CoaBC [Povalibacter sp.]HMN44277.1 bifunctional phosphopantothenoylcysteine decarboxylase/phosphopantothenate--cysteine ligase CoaBC [Povalibacter sp.]
MTAARKILLGVTGGIAAYKSPDLVRRLIDRGAEVQVVMTRGAQEFVTPLTFQAVSGRPVRTDLWDEAAEGAMGHIELARWADDIVIAPATADVLAKLAHGFAEDLLTTLCLASTASITVAPAMNRQMWANPATQANVKLLQSRGVRVLGPASGEQACGEVGAGRMLEPVQIAEEIFAALPVDGGLKGLKVVITAGPTREAIDPVRFISNRSSGKMGFAVAEAARQAGAKVVLVSGPVQIAAPPGVEKIPVETADQMLAAVQSQVKDADIFIAAAAVSDYRCSEVACQKIKKTSDNMTLALSRAPDVLATIGRSESPPFLVGFAAETENVEANALTKLNSKNLDMIAANKVGEGLAFDKDDNALTVYWRGGKQELSLTSKAALARQLVAVIAERYRSRVTTTTTTTSNRPAIHATR